MPELLKISRTVFHERTTDAKRLQIPSSRHDLKSLRQLCQPFSAIVAPLSYEISSEEISLPARDLVLNGIKGFTS